MLEKENQIMEFIRWYVEDDNYGILQDYYSITVHQSANNTVLVGVSQNGDTMIPRSGSFSSRRAVAVADSRSVGRPSSMSRVAVQVEAGRQTSIVADDIAASRV
jgi:hypothetical protein